MRRQRSFKKYEEHDRREETARRERDAGLREREDLGCHDQMVKLYGLFSPHGKFIHIYDMGKINPYKDEICSIIIKLFSIINHGQVICSNKTMDIIFHIFP